MTSSSLVRDLLLQLIFVAYLPVNFGEHGPLLIGTGVLNADVPLLASNVLLKALGMILNLNNMTATFEALGTTAHVVMISGHLAVRIDAFTSHVTHECLELLDRESWESAEPEVIFGFEPPHRGTQLKDAHCATAVTCSMEADRARDSELQDSFVHDHGQGSKARGMGSSVALGGHTTAPRPPVSSQPINVPACRDTAVRECHGPVQQLQTMRKEMAVGHRSRKMGSQALRRIFTLIGTAIALIGQYPGGTGSGSTPFFDFPEGGTGQDEHATTFGDIGRDFELRASLQDETHPRPRDRPLGADPQHRAHGTLGRAGRL